METLSVKLFEDQRRGDGEISAAKIVAGISDQHEGNGDTLPIAKMIRFDNSTGASLSGNNPMSGSIVGSGFISGIWNRQGFNLLSDKLLCFSWKSVPIFILNSC